MSHEIKIHDAQISILRELLFHPAAGFAELQKPTGLDSDHFKFHINRLLELGYVSKIQTGKYQLTPKGKEHANKLDTDTNTIERQPKLSILIVASRVNQDDEVEYLVQQRLKNPYFGYWGWIGGKIRWGETVFEAAHRELMEETGLRATMQYVRLYHKMDYNQQNGSMLEDKFFIVCRAIEFKGRLVEQFEGGKNAWLTQRQIDKQEKLFQGLEACHEFVDGAHEDLTEVKYTYDISEY